MVANESNEVFDSFPEPPDQSESVPFEPPDSTQLDLFAKVSKRTGPLPSPGELAQYNRVLPDAANRILTMAEKQQQHHHNMEQQVK